MFLFSLSVVFSIRGDHSSQLNSTVLGMARRPGHEIASSRTPRNDSVLVKWDSYFVPDPYVYSCAARIALYARTYFT